MTPKLRRLQTTVTSLAPGGDGVAHVDLDGERRAVFLPRSAPGDVAQAEVDLTRRPARGHILRLVTEGPDRVASACRWSERCGGCDWMHLSLAAQSRAHVEHVRGALPKAWQGREIVSHAATEPLRYRARARLHVRSERGRIEAGMHAAGTHEPVSVDECVALDPSLEAARRGLVPLFDACRGRGEVQLALGAGRRPVLEITWNGDLPGAFFGRLEQAVLAGDLAGARVVEKAATRPAVVGDPTPWVRGADGEPLRLAPGGFGQASELTYAALGRYVAALVAEGAPHRAVELYSGAGSLSVMVAPLADELVAVESDPAACEAARANLTARGLRARVTAADAALYEWPAATRLLVLDPPRTGAVAVAARLATSRVARVIYVSCDAQTLGRDLARLESAYALRSIATFEMFPQTSHVETVVELERLVVRR